MSELGDAQDLVERHRAALATAWAWVRDGGATRVTLLLDAQPTVLVEAAAGEPVVVQAGDGEPFALAGGDLPLAAPLVDPPRAAPASSIHVHPHTHDVSAPIGALSALADGVEALARTLGGRSVATVEYATHDPQRPLTFAAREGEQLLVAVGGDAFELGE